MRIALDATYSVDQQPSGIAVYSREIMAGLAARHAEDVFLHCYRAKQWRHATRPTSANVRNRPLLPFMPSALLNARVFHALNQRVDRRAAPNVVATFHDLFVLTGEYSSPDFRKRFAEQARRAAERCDLIVAVSEFTAGQVSALLRVEPTRIRVIPHGVPAVELAHATREKIVLSVGAIQRRKNTARLVEAFAAMPDDWQLLLAGAATGYGAPRILAAIAASPAKARIQLTGYVTPAELRRLYARASIFAFPSLDEGFGIPVLEAMAHGVPVVTSNVSALPEVAGDAALLVNPLDSDEIAGALLRLAENADLRESLIKRGIARAAQFTWRQAVEKTHAVYDEFGF